jgi:hypothetical protein
MSSNLKTAIGMGEMLAGRFYLECEREKQQ